MAQTLFTDLVTLIQAAWLNDVDAATYNTLSAVAGTNTITATGPTTVTSYAANQRFVFTPANSNTGATTINISSIGAKSIFANGAACLGGELRASVPVHLVYDGTQFHILGNAATTFPRNHISGLTYSNNSGDATNDIDIAAGEAVDSTNLRLMKLASSITKQSDAAWAVGTNAGGLDTGAVGNSDYYIWLITRTDTGVVDVLFSLSSTAPTMPANYTLKRLIGWFKRSGGTIVAFHTTETEGGGIELSWDVPTADIALSNTLTTSRRTDAVKVPLDLSVLAKLSIHVIDATNSFAAWVGDPNFTDAAPNNTPQTTTVSANTANKDFIYVEWIRTSSAGLIAARANLATVDIYEVSTYAFRWARRN